MKQGGRQKHSAGFTIVEVMIVLAVTGLIFAAAAVFISGRQNKTEFTVAINDLQQQLQQIMSQTASGYYPSGQSFTCSGSSSGPVINSGSGSQGSHDGCVFLGKVVQFGAYNQPQDQAYVYSLAGLQSGYSITSAMPKVIWPVNDGFTLENGLTPVYMHFVSADGSLSGSIGAVGFLTGDTTGTYATADGSGNLASGSLQFSTFAVTQTSINGITTAGAQRSIETPSNLVPAGNVTICFASGTTNQSGLITIDSSNNIKLDIKSGTSC